MNKKTISLPGESGEWGSYISKYQPDSSKVLDNMFTANSKNFVTDLTGMIDKRQGGVQWNRTTFMEAAKDTYEAIFENGARHFLRVGGGTLSASTGTGLFDVITSGYSPIGNFEWVTAQNRTYGCNGINPPQTYDIATSYGGVSYVFTTAKTKAMGAQAPVTTVTTSAPTAGGSVPAGAHRYRVTYMYYDSEESNGSPISAAQTATPGNQTIPLTNIPIGGYGVTARRIYRDNNDNNFLLLVQISDNTTTSFSDTLAIGSTPTPIPQFNDPPPTFSKCALWLDSIFIAPSGETNVIRYSNAGSPDIFDPDNFITCQSDDVVTALYVYNGKLYVFGLHSVGTIEGTTPDTFYYHNINNKIGCVDNRSIQVRSLVSVPTLWWLSDKGLYFSNGYTVEYGSDFIQDLVDLNIAQVNYSTNKNTQTSFTDFSGDTITPSIDINSQPGAVTQINPLKEWNSTSDWTGGSVTTNLKTSNANLAEVPTQFAPSLGSGSLGGSAQISGSNLNMPTTVPFTGENIGGGGASNSQNGFNFSPQGNTFANPMIPTSSGTLTSVNFLGTNTWTVTGCVNGTFKVWSDGGGVPGSVIYSQSVGNICSWNGTVPGISVFMTANTRYWFGIELAGANWVHVTIAWNTFTARPTGQVFGSTTQVFNGAWNGQTIGGFNVRVSFQSTFSASPVSGSGTWTSQIYDSGSLGAIAGTITESGSYPASTSGTVTIFASANSNMSGSVNQVVSNPNGTTALSLSGYRYWQIVVTLNTTNNQFTPTMGTPLLTFNTSATWVSQPIDGTSDNTDWMTLTFSGNVPAGTSVTLTIATSTNNITYSSFGPIGSAATTRWAKVRFVLTTDAGNTVSPSVSSVSLTWSVTGEIISSAIDTGTDPAGFAIFQWSEINLGVGSVTFYIRTASTAPGLSLASWVQVDNGAFPALTALRFVQWRGVLTSTANNTPVITDVTVNWYTASGSAGVRCSSVFYNKTYYLSVATLGATTNNTIIQLDQFGKWRIQKDASVGTFLLYFNSLYFTDGANGNIYNGFIASTDNGSPIVMDVRTKAWSEKSDMFLKIPRGLKVSGVNTGTFIRAYYSTNRGVTWIEMLNELGQLGFQTTTALDEFTILFVPNADTLVSGRTLMYRLVSADAFPCSISDFEPSFYTRRARYLSNG